MAKAIFYTMLGAAVVLIAAFAIFFLYYGKSSTIISGSVVNITAGQRISNFLAVQVNPSNVTGLLYTEYPVARLNGTPDTVYVGDSVGYVCDGTLAKLIAIHGNKAVFRLNTTKSKYGCPI